jgi:hypothetical protein
MKSVVLLLLAAVALIATACTQGAVPLTATPPVMPAADALEDYFPLAPGAAWVYEGAVKWEGCGGICDKTISWKMEVLNVVQRSDFIAYAMHGHPADLAWYTEGKFPSVYAIVQKGPAQYYRATLETFKRLQDPADRLDNLLNERDLFLDAPLYPGKRFGEVEQLALPDGQYCWIVQSEAQPLSHAIRGVSPDANFSEYTLSFVTLPDHTSVRFAPGVGMTHYTYVHHGTISEVDMQLIEYHPGRDLTSP